MRTNEELNKVIAEWCGWREETTVEYYYGALIKKVSVPPSYSTDLNAMHEAMLKLNDIQWDRMAEELTRVIEQSGERSNARYWLRTTSRQRAEALVAVIEGTKT